MIKEFRDDEMEHHDTGLAHDAENVSVFYVFKCNVYTLPVKTLGTPSHSMFFLIFFLLLSTL